MFSCNFSVSDGTASVDAICFSRVSIFVCRSVIRSCWAKILASWLFILDFFSLFYFSVLCSFCRFQFRFKLPGSHFFSCRVSFLAGLMPPAVFFFFFFFFLGGGGGGHSLLRVSLLA